MLVIGSDSGTTDSTLRSLKFAGFPLAAPPPGSIISLKSMGFIICSSLCSSPIRTTICYRTASNFRASPMFRLSITNGDSHGHFEGHSPKCKVLYYSWQRGHWSPRKKLWNPYPPNVVNSPMAYPVHAVLRLKKRSVLEGASYAFN